MFSQYFHAIESILMYPIVSLFFFMAAFIAVVIWAMLADEGYIRTMEQLPLDSPTDRSGSELPHTTMTSTKGMYR